MVVVTILLSFVTLIFGELVPKRIALQNAEAYSMFCAKPILIISKIASPFIKILSWSTRFVLRLFGMKDEMLKNLFPVRKFVPWWKAGRRAVSSMRMKLI